MKNFDVFVIGTGVAGTAIARKCVAAGLSVGITDNKQYGGTCARRGCDPKKVLVDATEIVDLAGRLAGKGIEGVPTINWPELMAFKQTFVEPVPEDKEKSFKKSGIATFHDRATFVSRNRLKVGVETIEAKNIVIATGAKPRDLDIAGKQYARTSTDFLSLKSLPESMVFAGGGYIAFEFAHLAARCGSKVTIIEMAVSPLENFEQDIVKHLVTATEHLGIELVLETDVTGIHKRGEKFVVVGLHHGEPVEYPADAVFNSSGRVPALDGLNLDVGDVRFSGKGIEVNRHLQSVSNDVVYAAGDVSNSGLPLTPIATLEAKTVAENIISGNSKIADYTATPSVVYTVPPLASVGLTENSANEKKLDFNVNYQSVPNWFNAKRLNEKQYAFKILTDKSSGKILGAHLIGPGADETINLFAMAMKAGLSADQIKDMLYAYPSFASDIAHMV